MCFHPCVVSVVPLSIFVCVCVYVFVLVNSCRLLLANKQLLQQVWKHNECHYLTTDSSRESRESDREATEEMKAELDVSREGKYMALLTSQICTLS